MVRNIQLQNTFSGPLDLLLYLVRRDEIDIHDIPIGHVTREYLNELKKMEVIDVDAGGEFLAMASMLTEIKGRMLLPEVENEDEDEDEIYDPRQGLVEALLEYKKFKEVAAELEAMSCAFDSRYSRVVKEPEYTEVVREKAEEMGALDLLAAFQRIARRMLNERAPREIVSEEVPTEVRITQIEELLTQRSRVSFSSILSDSPSEDEMVGFFIAMLELIRMKKIVAQQAVDFSEIYFIAASAVESYDQEQAATESEVAVLDTKDITVVAGFRRRSEFVLSSPFSYTPPQQWAVGAEENIIGNRYDPLCRRCKRNVQSRPGLQRSFRLKLVLNLHTRLRSQASPGVEIVQPNVNENVEVIPVFAPVIPIVAEGLLRAGSKHKHRSGLSSIFALPGSLQGTVAGRVQAERACKSGRFDFFALISEPKSVNGLSQSYNSLEFLRLTPARPLAKNIAKRGIAMTEEEVSAGKNRVESSFVASLGKSSVMATAALGAECRYRRGFGLSSLFALAKSSAVSVAGRVQAERACKSGRFDFFALIPEPKSVNGLSQSYNSLEFLRLTPARPLAKNIAKRGIAMIEEEVSAGKNRVESSFVASLGKSSVMATAALGAECRYRRGFGLSSLFALAKSSAVSVAGRVQAERACKSGRFDFFALVPEPKSVNGLSQSYNSLEFLRLTAARPLAKYAAKRGIAMTEEEVSAGKNRVEIKQKQVTEVEVAAYVGMGLPVKLAALFPLQAQPDMQPSQACASTLDFMGPLAGHKLLRLKAGMKRNFLKL